MHVILQTNFNKRSVAVSSRQRGRCQLDMVNKLLIPAAPTLNIGHGSPVRLRKTMVAIGNAPFGGSFRAQSPALFAQLIGERRVEVRGAVCLNASLEITASTGRLSWLNACRHDRCDC